MQLQPRGPRGEAVVSKSPESSREPAGRRGQFQKGLAPRGKPFRKGQSGNPGGVSATEAEVRRLARSHGPEAIERLVELMRQGSDRRLALQAAVALLDRGFGKPDMAINNTGAPLVNINLNAPPDGKLTPQQAYELLRGDLSMTTIPGYEPPALEAALVEVPASSEAALLAAEVQGTTVEVSS